MTQLHTTTLETAHLKYRVTLAADVVDGKVNETRLYVVGKIK